MSKLEPHHSHRGPPHVLRLGLMAENGVTSRHQCVIPITWKIKCYYKTYETSYEMYA